MNHESFCFQKTELCIGLSFRPLLLVNLSGKFTVLILSLSQGPKSDLPPFPACQMVSAQMFL